MRDEDYRPMDGLALSYEEFVARCGFEDGPQGEEDRRTGDDGHANDNGRTTQQALAPLDWRACAKRAAPPRRWLVEGWIPFGTTTALYGNGGLGKTQVGQQLLTAAATGRPWLGLPLTQAPAVGLFCEDGADELWRRQEAINAHLGLDYADLGDLHLIPRVGEDNGLMTFGRDGRGAVTPLYGALTRRALTVGARTVLIDTAADVFLGNENDRGHVRQFIGALNKLALAIQGQVVLLAHPSRAGLSSGEGDGGSTAWSNGVRARLYLTRPNGEENDRDTRVLRAMKANYGPVGAEITLRWRHGVFVNTAATDGGTVGAIDQRVQEAAVEEAFLACLRAARASGRLASDTTASRDRYAPKLFRTLPEGQTCSFKDLKAAMDRLFAANRIRVESVQTTNRHYVGAIVEVVQ